ncbi:MAG: glycosyltransferase [Clostridia bacterium]|nr:glycosyltransferase [Clostridia bacterium]
MISLIVPFYNCENTVDKTMKKIIEYRKSIPFELITVDDGSTDNTAAKLSKYVCDDVGLISYEKNKGKGGAVREGVMAAKGDKIIFTDSDLAYGLKHLKDFSDKLEENEIVIGTRRCDDNINESYGVKRNISSRIFSLLVQMILGLNISDTQCGFKGYRRETARKLFDNLEIYGFGFDLEILAKAKKEKIFISQIPVIMENNSASSNVKIISDGIGMIFDMFKIRKIIKK